MAGHGFAWGLGSKKQALRAACFSAGLFWFAGCGKTEQSPSATGGAENTAGGAATGGGSIDGIPPCAALPEGCGGTGAEASGGVTSNGGKRNAGGSTSRGGAVGDGATAGTANDSGGRTSGSGGRGTAIAPPHPTAQLDLLFMIDNSISMADKQEVLAQAVPQLLERLMTPLCVNADGTPTGAKASSSGTCTKGEREFSPVNDIHVGIITSSLGAHGGQTCAPAGPGNEALDDKGQLVGKVRPKDPNFPYETWNDSGFLAWDPDGAHNTPPGEADLSAFTTNLTHMIQSVGQTGCGYEASLEAWYRFLVDPDPPTSVPTVTDTNGVTTPIVPIDPAQNPVLVQRAAFLRPDSALVILMLSDENDCSIVDQGQGWLVGAQNLGGGAFHMPRATSVCDVNPNDPCCHSCVAAAPAACPMDPSCAQQTLSAQDDNLNLRCFDQKRRFGFDLLYPLARYVDGLTETSIPRRNGQVVANPLFPAGGRTPSMVFLGGIVGVPWQDLANKASFTAGAPLAYLNHQELTAQNRWSLVLGSEGDAENPPSPPGDKLMFETPKDRTTLFGNALHPLIGSGTLAPSSAVSQPNSINGHETNIADNSDLQYACIFELPTPRDCAAGALACDCKAADASHNRPVCNGTIQTHAKAYPSVRQLRVLKEVGDLTGTTITTSICPKTLDDTGPNAGYGPNVSALLRGLKSVLVP